MMRSLLRSGVVAGAVLVGACDLAVQNPQQPDTDRVLATPADVETLLGRQYSRWHAAAHSSLSNVWGMVGGQAFEGYASLANNGQGARNGIPRGGNDNAVGNLYGAENQRMYYIHSESARVAASVLGRLNAAGFSLGSSNQDNRARAFAEFVRGISLGYLALVYDSAAIITAELGSEDPGELAGYAELMDAAIEALGNAITAATAAGTGANGFPLPGTWIPSPTTMSSAEFVKLVRSYRARLRANVARTPAERAAVDWAAVIADAQNGITADHMNTTNTVTGPFNTWPSTWATFTTWHQMVPAVAGMGDVSGAYEAYVAKSWDDRGKDGPFFMVTPDQRWPQGATRAAQQADFAITSCNTAGSTCKRYFVNRPEGNDQTSGSSWGHSNYDYVGYYTWRQAGAAVGATAGNGPIAFMRKAEIDLLQAEGLYRTGNYAAAAALINLTRVAKGQLPAITTFDATSPVPGGANCVPRVPVGPSFTTVACGNMFEALKWEKRMETIHSHFGAWWLDSRGWGDLVEGTGLHFAPPYEDLQARGRTGAGIYSTGGATGNAVAARGTYGW